MAPIPEGAFRGHLMAEPSVPHLQSLMHHVFTHREESVAIGQQARADMVARFHPRRMSRFVAAHVDRIAHKVLARHGKGSHDHDGDEL